MRPPPHCTPTQDREHATPPSTLLYPRSCIMPEWTLRFAGQRARRVASSLIGSSQKMRTRSLSAADQIDIEFATLLRVLLYTGLRLGEVLHGAGMTCVLTRARRGPGARRTELSSDVILRRSWSPDCGLCVQQKAVAVCFGSTRAVTSSTC